MVRFPLIILLVLCVTASFGQSKRKRASKTKSEPKQSSSLAPYYPEKDYAPKEKSRKKSRKRTYNAEEDFDNRMKAAVKANNKAEKEMLKPQYSDFTYFGHKRPPKKRPPGKMKFCKVCEIRH
jgi:hypothetical protein